MNTTSLIRTKLGRGALGLGAVTALTIAAFGIPGGAQAKSVRCDSAGTCKTYCTQSLPNGNYIEYEEGTNIIVTNQDGTETHYTCKNGEWVKTSKLIGSTSVLAQTGRTKLSVLSR